VSSFLEFIYFKLLQRDGRGMKIWSLYGFGKFDVCSYYAKLTDMNDISFPWKSIWSVKAPRQVSSFIWTTAWGKILTNDNLIKRGYSLVSWCCMCQQSGEIVEHLLLHCDIASGLWNVVFAVFGIHWVMLKMVAELLFGWQNWFGSVPRLYGILYHYVDVACVEGVK
jgi:hypothetical protein